jgi:hypothetical protein
MDKQPGPYGKECSAAPGVSTVTALFPSVQWDITDEEISEWKRSPGMILAGYTAECIKNGQYDDGREIYPPESVVYKEVTRQTVDKAMEILAARGMTAKRAGAWRAITPGRLEPGARRAVAVLLACRQQLPPALATELDSYKELLDAMYPHARGGRLASGTTGRALAPARPARAIAAG